MTVPDGDPAISEHWTVTSYDQAMQLGAEALRRSYVLPSRLAPDADGFTEFWIRLGHYRALQAAAWFAFARERREAEVGPAVGGPPGPLDTLRPPDPPLS